MFPPEKEGGRVGKGEKGGGRESMSVGVSRALCFKYGVRSEYVRKIYV